MQFSPVIVFFLAIESRTAIAYALSLGVDALMLNDPSLFRLASEFYSLPPRLDGNHQEFVDIGSRAANCGGVGLFRENENDVSAVIDGTWVARNNDSLPDPARVESERLEQMDRVNGNTSSECELEVMNAEFQRVLRMIEQNKTFLE